MLRIVIRRPNLIPFRVRKLPLDRIRVPSLLVEQRRRHAAKPVSGHLFVRVPKPPQRSVDGVVAHRSVAVSLSRKNEPPAAGQRTNLPQNLDSLSCKGNVMMRPHFHARRGDTPLTFIEVEFSPFGHPQFTWPHEDKRRKAQRTACYHGPGITVDRPQQRPPRTLAPRCWRDVAASAPRRSRLMSRSARPLATASRSTRPQFCGARCALSLRPPLLHTLDDCQQIDGLDVSNGLCPSHGKTLLSRRRMPLSPWPRGPMPANTW